MRWAPARLCAPLHAPFFPLTPVHTRARGAAARPEAEGGASGNAPSGSRPFCQLETDDFIVSRRRRPLPCVLLECVSVPPLRNEARLYGLRINADVSDSPR